MISEPNTPENVPARRLSPKRGRTRGGVTKLDSPFNTKDTKISNSIQFATDLDSLLILVSLITKFVILIRV